MSVMAGAPEHIEASLNYSVDRKFSRVVSIYDGRAILGQLSLEKQGFVLTHRETAVRDFYDAAEVRSIYYPEVEQLLKDMTGAAKVLAFEHDVRCLPASKQGQKGVREPVRVVHDDYTEKSAPERVRLYLPEEAEGLLKSRFAVINVWRPIAGPVLDTPLAVCDAQSLAEHDLIPTEENVKHEVYLFRFSQNHRWYYFPHMQRSEALLIKCFDSVSDGRARFTAHSAFDDLTTPPNTAARESIEVRALAFFTPHA
jgi:hypothetical protein